MGQADYTVEKDGEIISRTFSPNMLLKLNKEQRKFDKFGFDEEIRHFVFNENDKFLYVNVVYGNQFNETFKVYKISNEIEEVYDLKNNKINELILLEDNSLQVTTGMSREPHILIKGK